MHPSPPGPHSTQHKGHQRHPACISTTRPPPSIPHHPPLRAPGPHHTHHPTPSTTEKNHGNHARSKHRKALRTANPDLRTKINSEVQSSHNTYLDSSIRTSDTPPQARPHGRQGTTPKPQRSREARKRHINNMAARN